MTSLSRYILSFLFTFVLTLRHCCLHARDLNVEDVIGETNSTQYDSGSGKAALLCQINDAICCKSVYEKFKLTWSTNDFPLTRFLDNLEQSNCSEFKYECQHRTFAYNDFSSLVYDRFCNVELFRKACITENDNNEKDVATSSIPSVCQQVQMYRSDKEYLEILTSYTPFCGLVWCGFDLQTFEALNASTWTCMQSRCQLNVVILMVLCGMLGFVTMFLNSTVLYIFWKSPKLSQQSQLLYRFSLGVADLLVGLIVFPTYVSTLYYRLVAKRQVVFNGSSYGNGIATFEDLLPPGYLPVIGMVTTLSFAVSIYTLVLAGFDKLQAVRKPLKFDKFKSARCAKVMLILVWAMAITISILPLFSPGLYPYSLIAGLIAATKSEHALYEYFFGFVIPLIGVWVALSAIFYILKKRDVSSQRMRARSKNREERQRRTYNTLLIMLVGFTVSLVPTIIAVMVQLDGRSQEILPEVYDPQIAAGLSSFALFSGLLLTCNSLWNFFIYSARNQKFKRTVISLYKSIFSKIICHRSQDQVFSTSRSLASTKSRSTFFSKRKRNESTSSGASFRSPFRTATVTEHFSSGNYE